MNLKKLSDGAVLALFAGLLAAMFFLLGVGVGKVVL